MGESIGNVSSEMLGNRMDLSKTMIFLSREIINETQEAYLNKVLASGVDLERLSLESEQRLIAPISFGHLIKLAQSASPVRLEHWRKARQGWVARSMLFREAMAQFHSHCIDATGAQHVYVKGPSLAAQYYQNPFFRQCRDIDILVSQPDVKNVIHEALEQGYAFVGSLFDAVAHRGDEAAEAYISMSDVISMRSPEGVHFEIHKTLDRNSGLFRTRALCEMAEPMSFHGTEVNVLPAEMAFCYVAYHSTQHTWARLNWFTDVNAILKSPGFDRVRCLELARGHGILELTSACIELDDWLTAGAENAGELNPEARELFRLLQRNIEGNLATEKELMLAEHTIGLPRRFHASFFARLRAFLRHVKTSFSADMALYSRYPLPKRLWWVYSLLRPAHGLVGLVKSRLSGSKAPLE